jgi:NAD-dependent DNA ligase
LSGVLLPTHVEQLQALDAQLPIAGRESVPSPPFLIADVCAVDPRITFVGKTFVFTGQSARAEREDMATVVLALGGTEEPDVTRRSDYLVVCDGGSEFWAFSSYGRKVEQAYVQRQQGHQIVIVHERDFWEAVTGHGMTA